MWTQALAIGVIAASHSFVPWMVGSVFLGVGTALVYPTLLAAIGDVAHPTWRASSVGVYRMWRDAGYVAGALIAGMVADRLGLSAAIWVVAVITFVSGTIVAVRMYETSRPGGERDAKWRT
jgi:MFS family permease